MPIDDKALAYKGLNELPINSVPLDTDMYIMQNEGKPVRISHLNVSASMLDNVSSNIVQNDTNDSDNTALNPVVRTVTQTITITQLNDGGDQPIVFLEGVENKSIRVLNFIATVAGTWTGLTAFKLQSNEDTPKDIVSIAQTALSAGLLLPLSVGVTLGSLNLELDLGVGLKAVKTGGLILTGTDIDLTIQYSLT